MKWIGNTYPITAIGCDGTFYTVEENGDLHIRGDNYKAWYQEDGKYSKIKREPRPCHLESPAQAKQIAEEINRLDGKAK